MALLAADAPVYMRGTHFIVYAVEAGERVQMRLAPRPMKKGTLSSPGYELIDHASRVVANVPGIDGPTTIRYIAEAGGLNALAAKGGRGWYSVDGLGRPFVVRASQRRAFHHKGVGRPIYFMVPQGVRSFQVIVTCPDKREGATVRVFDPNGKQVFEGTDWYHTPHRIKLRATPEQQGRAWSFRTASAKLKGKPYGWDDVVVCFAGKIPPFVSTCADWLARVLVAAGEVEAGQVAIPRK